VCSDLEFNSESPANEHNKLRRGRTTTGMVAACLISTILTQDISSAPSLLQESDHGELGDYSDGPSLEEVYMQGGCRCFFKDTLC
jgi:hypothetical protein